MMKDLDNNEEEIVKKLYNEKDKKLYLLYNSTFAKLSSYGLIISNYVDLFDSCISYNPEFVNIFKNKRKIRFKIRKVKN